MYHLTQLKEEGVQFLSMPSLQDGHEIKAQRAGHVSVYLSVHPSVHIIEIQNRWADMDEIWYGIYAIGDLL